MAALEEGRSVEVRSLIAPSSEIRWRCPDCGCSRATLRKPNETGQEATSRVIDDHIKSGCPAFSPIHQMNQPSVFKMTINRKHESKTLL